MGGIMRRQVSVIDDEPLGFLLGRHLRCILHQCECSSDNIECSFSNLPIWSFHFRFASTPTVGQTRQTDFATGELTDLPVRRNGRRMTGIGY